jgi:hypothetical protein
MSKPYKHLLVSMCRSMLAYLAPKMRSRRGPTTHPGSTGAFAPAGRGRILVGRVYGQPLRHLVVPRRWLRSLAVSRLEGPGSRTEEGDGDDLPGDQRPQERLTRSTHGRVGDRRQDLRQAISHRELPRLIEATSTQCAWATAARR